MRVIQTADWQLRASRRSTHLRRCATIARSWHNAREGYIMDQWLGCSVNLLCGREVVKMDHMLRWHREKRAKVPERRLTSHVSARNTGRDYERFHAAIETLAATMGPDWNPEATELTLMSNGGKRPGAWRAHVKRERLARFGD